MNYFTKQQLLTMLQLQKEANDVMSDSWLSSVNGCPSEGGISYYRAAMVEAHEAIDHLSFKWWKKYVPNVKQTNLELIDILHFALSDFYRSHHDDLDHEVDCLLEDLEELCIKVLVNMEEMRNCLEDFAVSCYTRTEASLIGIIELCYRFGLSTNYIYNTYVGKNVLNKFRTANGQRENKYIKIWGHEEDNVFLENYLESLEDDKQVDSEDLNNYLTKCYADVLKDVSNR